MMLKSLFIHYKVSNEETNFSSLEIFYYLQVNYILRNIKATSSKQKRIIFHLSDKAIVWILLVHKYIHFYNIPFEVKFNEIYTNVYIYLNYRLKIFFRNSANLIILLEEKIIARCKAFAFNGTITTNNINHSLRKM